MTDTQTLAQVETMDTLVRLTVGSEYATEAAHGVIAGLVEYMCRVTSDDDASLRGFIDNAVDQILPQMRLALAANTDGVGNA